MTSDSYWGTTAQHDVALTASGGTTWQWQQRESGGSWANISGATSASFTPDIGVNATYGYELRAVPDGNTAAASAAYVIRYSSADFVMTAETTTASEDFDIALYNSTNPSVANPATVEWGDGTSSTITAYNDADLTHTYASAGTHVIRVTGTVSGVRMSGATHRAKLRTVETLGNLGWHGQALQGGFSDCTGLTSFAAGDTGGPKFVLLFAAFLGNTSLTTIDLTGMDFSIADNAAQMFAACPSLTTITGFTNMWDGVWIAMDEMLDGSTPQALIETLDISGFDLSNGASNVMFNFVADTRAFSQSVIDNFYVNLLSQTFANSDIFLGLGDSPYTTGGAVESARTSLINSGVRIEDAGNAPPEVAAAPALAVDSSSQITVTLPSDPFTNGLPISGRAIDYRDVTGGGSWTEFGNGYTEGQAVPVTGLTALNEYEFRGSYTNFNGTTDGTAASETTLSGAGVFDVAEVANDIEITATGTDPGDTFSITINSGTAYTAGTYTQDIRDSSTITVSEVDSAPVPFYRGTITGSTGLGDELGGLITLFISNGDQGDYTFQWTSDGVDISGATDPTFTITADEQGTDVRREDTYGGVTVATDPTSIPAGSGIGTMVIGTDFTVA